MFHENKQIGGYILIRKLGKGGFGEVWLAEKRSQFVTKRVAVKFPHEDQVNFEAIRHEATLWEQASGHANILPIIDADIYDGQVLIVSEYADGGSLHDKLKLEGKLSIKQSVEMAIGILSGLGFLHKRQIIHRDIKPENILLQDDLPRLTDFGISRVISADSLSRSISGTYEYMAPECFDGKRNVKTDIWSVGVILYRMLTGNLPFAQEEQTSLFCAIVTTEPDPLPNSVPKALQKIVSKALTKAPEARYQNANEMREDLQDFLNSFSQRKSIAVYTPKDTVTINDLKLIPYRKGDKWGFCDSDKNIIIPPQYDKTYAFPNGLAEVRLNGKYGFINKTGNLIIPLIYQSIEPFSEGLARVQLNDKYGFVDTTRNVIIPIIYDYAWFSKFSEGLAMVKFNNKDFYIDKKGTEYYEP